MSRTKQTELLDKLRDSKTKKRKHKPQKDQPRNFVTYERDFANVSLNASGSFQRKVNDELFSALKKSQRRDGSSYMYNEDWSNVLEQMGRFNFSANYLNSLTSKVEMPLSRIASVNDREFVRVINKNIGIDIGALFNSRQLRSTINKSMKDTAALIVDVNQDYMNATRFTVRRGVTEGWGLDRLKKELKEATGEKNDNRVRRIARDQTGQLMSNIEDKRAKDLGLEYYGWGVSKDGRVSGNPNGKYPNAKISCYHIARDDIGFGKGVYRYDTGATYAGESGLHPKKAHINCRCGRIPLIVGINFELPKR